MMVPETPSLLLLHGRFDNSVDVMVGHNGNEGMAYPSLTNNTVFEGNCLWDSYTSPICYCGN
jgi:hypothetical protein